MCRIKKMTLIYSGLNSSGLPLPLHDLCHSFANRCNPERNTCPCKTTLHGNAIQSEADKFMLIDEVDDALHPTYYIC